MSVIYSNIKKLCDNNNLNITQLEKLLGFGAATISKWQNNNIPSSDKISAIADYFNVSTDYILGRTFIQEKSDDILNDNDLISLQRAKRKMTRKDQENVSSMLSLFIKSILKDENGEGDVK